MPESPKSSTGMVSVATSRTTLIVPYDQRFIKKRTKKYAEPLQLLEATLNAKITAEDCSGTTHSAMREMEKPDPSRSAMWIWSCGSEGTTRNTRILRVLLGFQSEMDWLNVLPRGMWVFMKGRTL